ncbi:FUSC family protein [Streptomyces sp. KN37]|uniref:FUSC family protein n=2 Tax=unclassified Streptomyces TaxID=2593676 RepID=UPI002A74A21A|nr:aromatic acid exporter family protein [Streptomyces sp. KN37]WPO73142.1 aromatic acid exporter family protein [Streptomyces sp. KN37]
MTSTVRGAGAWLGRAWTSPGHERNTVLMMCKSALAATVAWWIAHDLLHAKSPAFAPFSAVLIMNVTVYQSVWQAVRYTGAVTVGVAVQAVLGFLIGPDLFVFPLVALIALAVGQWPVLGEQRSQVATAAFFAFSTYATASTLPQRAENLAEIVVLVLIGCGLGVLVNTCVAPPLRYRGAEQGLRSLACEIESLLSDMAQGLRHQDVSEERTRAWAAAGERAHRSVAQARAALDTAQNSLPFNPRRLLPAHRKYLTFHRYRRVLNAMERAVYQLVSLTRSLHQWRESEETYTYTPVLRAYADFASSLQDIAGTLSRLDADVLESQAEQVCRQSATAQRALKDVLDAAQEHRLPLADPSRPYGVLIVEATRLMEEFQYTGDTLRTTAAGPE